jgi:hypothetical protein
MEKSLSFESARAPIQKQQKEASKHAAPYRERIRTCVGGGAAPSYHFYRAYQNI